MNKELVAQQRVDLGQLMKAAFQIGKSQVKPERRAQQLYQTYCGAKQVGGLRLDHVNDQAAPRIFLESLIHAHDSRWTWESGYKLIGGEQILTLESPAGNHIQAQAISYDGPDHTGHGMLLKKSYTGEPDDPWVFFHGESDHPKGVDLVRCYWAIPAVHATTTTAMLSKRLNKNRVPYTFKFLTNPDTYGRADSCVLYVPQYAWERGHQVIADCHAELEPYLLDRRPLLTRTVARGLSIAQDPGGGESFGMTRCKQILQAIDEALETPSQDDVEAYLETLGLTAGRYHLRQEDSNELDW